jgi:hypothetical protein
VCRWDVKKPVVKRYKQATTLVDDPSVVVGATCPGDTTQQSTVVT